MQMYRVVSIPNIGNLGMKTVVMMQQWTEYECSWYQMFLLYMSFQTIHDTNELSPLITQHNKGHYDLLPNHHVKMVLIKIKDTVTKRFDIKLLIELLLSKMACL